MKMLLFALFALSLFAADSKQASPSIPTERPLTTDEVLQSQYNLKSVLLLAKQYDLDEHQKQIQEFQKAAQPFQSANNETVIAACKSLGIAEKDIASECGFTNGLDQNGKPMLDQNGKPVVPRVWKIPQAPKPVSAAEKK